MTEKEQKNKKSSLPKERVTIFGSSDDQSGNKQSNTVYGLILIGVGVLFFLNTLDLVPWEVWGSLWKFWPLFLIFWGFQIIFSSNRATHWLVTIVGFILVGFVILFVIYQTNSSLLQSLPPEFDQIFSIMDRIQQR